MNLNELKKVTVAQLPKWVIKKFNTLLDLNIEKCSIYESQNRYVIIHPDGVAFTPSKK